MTVQLFAIVLSMENQSDEIMQDKWKTFLRRFKRNRSNRILDATVRPIKQNCGRLKLFIFKSAEKNMPKKYVQTPALVYKQQGLIKIKETKAVECAVNSVYFVRILHFRCVNNNKTITF